MAIGIALRCIEDIEVQTYDDKYYDFKEGQIYLGVPEKDGVYVVDREHKPLLLSDKLLIRHFKQY